VMLEILGEKYPRHAAVTDLALYRVPTANSRGAEEFQGISQLVLTLEEHGATIWGDRNTHKIARQLVGRF